MKSPSLVAMKLLFTVASALWLLYGMQVCFGSPLMSSSEVSSSNNVLPPPVQLHINDHNVELDNGLVQVILSKPGGLVTGVRYGGIDNVLEIHNAIDNRGYWDIVWREPPFNGTSNRLKETEFRVIMEDENQVELSFSKTWNLSRQGTILPLNVDKRFIMRRGSSGFYMYGILERLEGWPEANIDQIRIVFKLLNDKFHYMAISDDKQRIMPTQQDRATGQRLAYPEAVLLTNPSNPLLKGEVDDKYQYCKEIKDNKLIGWISTDPQVGFWLITPSQEFFAGGPTRTVLTSHVGPTLLSVFTGTHYAGMYMDVHFQNGEPWKKVFGPIFIYLNSLPGKSDYQRLWADAKRQMSVEIESWPYSFIRSEDFPSSDRRGTVSGRLMIEDEYISKDPKEAAFAYVGLAAPGNAGSWQTDTKGYQFWIQANQEGYFLIKNVRAGDYNLYAWVPGVIGDYKYEVIVTIKPGSNINLSVLTYNPPRTGPTLWEIGIPDRSAAEFFVPDPNPKFENRLFKNKPRDKYRQYGLWQRYTDLYPKQDLVYNVGISNYSQDWFFAHVTRNAGNKTYLPTTWQIVFELQNVSTIGNYRLQLALAAANGADVEVRCNNQMAKSPHFKTGFVGRDNAIARHGIHGLYWLYSSDLPSRLFVQGKNILYLTQAIAEYPFSGVMYDYIRLEGPRQG